MPRTREWMILTEAKEEIVRLRRRNEILEAQMDMINLFRATLMTHPPAVPPAVGGIHNIDVLDQIDSMIEREEKKGEKKDE